MHPHFNNMYNISFGVFQDCILQANSYILVLPGSWPNIPAKSYYLIAFKMEENPQSPLYEGRKSKKGSDPNNM